MLPLSVFAAEYITNELDNMQKVLLADISEEG